MVVIAISDGLGAVGQAGEGRRAAQHRADTDPARVDEQTADRRVVNQPARTTPSSTYRSTTGHHRPPPPTTTSSEKVTS